MSFGAPENDHQDTNEVSRRTLVKAAAWTVPVIAFAAPVPAMAASPCTPSTNFDGLEVGSRPTEHHLLQRAEPADRCDRDARLELQRAGRRLDAGRHRASWSRRTQGWNYLESEMLSPLTAGDWVQLDLTIVGGPVTGLSFIVHDIDKVQGAWTDNVGRHTRPATPSHSAATSRARAPPATRSIRSTSATPRSRAASATSG